MKPFDRYVWIMSWVITRDHHVDVLNAEFSDAYIEDTEAKFKPTMWGAHRCSQLSRDLAHMAKVGALKRYRTGLGTNWQQGFPKWVWSYSEGHASYLYLEVGGVKI